jgi:membrane peptidoglycan carboxypeptidase
MGILVNGGLRLPSYDLSGLDFASGTPYETVLKRAPAAPEHVIRPEIVQAMRRVLGEVVDNGTGRRLKGTFRDAQGQPLAVGGKTGSGDNHHVTFGRDGTLLSSQPVSRTAVFVFYLGERWYGVITASVEGPRSGDYTFTSSLPLAALKLLAPALGAALQPGTGTPVSAPRPPTDGPHATAP